MSYTTYALELLILAAGIHAFLRFVRATRGNRLIRGMLVTVLGGYVGLWGLSEAFELAEISHLLEASTGFFVVTLAIVFQSELRRGIAQIGERSFVGRLIQPAGRDSLGQVARAAQSMASRRVGALIAFERESSLQGYVEEGTAIDADVNARLLESLFHPGTALHDGAVVIRRDRIAAAGCFFPLPVDAKLDANLGTRHRAAVGITEDTDAVVVVVSEETGHISIAREGEISPCPDPDAVEDVLRRILHRKDAPRRRARRRFLPSGPTAWRRDLAWFGTSLLVAGGILFIAHRQIQQEETFYVRIQGVGPNEQRRPGPNELFVVLPSENMRLVQPDRQDTIPIVVRGTRAEVEDFDQSPAGVLEIESPDWNGGYMDLAKVRWQRRVPGLSISWGDESPPDLVVELIEERSFQVTQAMVTPDLATLGSSAIATDQPFRFEPTSVVHVRGPRNGVQALGSTIPLAFEPLDLSGTDPDERRATLQLTRELRDLDLSLVDEPPVTVVVPIQPARREIGTVNHEIALVCLDPARQDELARWQLPAHARAARFAIVTVGLIPLDADVGSPAWAQRIAEIRKFVVDNLIVYVDVAELPKGGEVRGVPVRYHFRDEDWEATLGSSLPGPASDEGKVRRSRGDLSLRILTQDEVLLEPRTPGSDESGGAQATQGGDGG